MSQYLSAFAILLMVMSPLLIPAIVAVVHRAIVGVVLSLLGEGLTAVPADGRVERRRETYSTE